MGRNRRGQLIGLIYLIGMITYNFCVFLLLRNYSVAVWISYGFTMLAFLIQIVLGCIFNLLNKDAKFMSISTLVAGNIYLCVELVFSIIFMNLMIAYKAVLIVQFVFLSLFIVFVLLSEFVKDSVMESENKIKCMTDTFTMLVRDAEYLYQVEEDKEKKIELKKLYEGIRYSDPVSSTEEICKMDEQIVSSFGDIYENISLYSIEDLKKKNKLLLDLVKNRNVLCKTTK